MTGTRAAPQGLALRTHRAWRRRAFPVPFVVRRFIARTAKGHIEGRPRVCLDVGAGTSPYRASLVEQLGVGRYVGLELAPSDATDVVADARRLPFADGSLDLVVCFEAIQHIPDAARVLDEMTRVLRPEGHVLISFPFLYGECDVRDFYRWTLSGMRQELERRGLRVLAAEGRGGPLFAVASLLHWALQHLVPGGRRSWRARRGAAAAAREALLLVLTLPTLALQWLALGLDAVLPRGGLYAGGLVLARAARTPAKGIA